MTASDWSVPETEVVQRIGERLETGAGGVLATVVDVAGNAYRRPGAKMLVDEEGSVGSITAGCLEEDIERVGERVRDAGRPELVTYDLMEDDADDVWGLGVGCNGVVDVLLEPLSETYRPAVEAFQAGADVAVCTVLEAPGGEEDDGETDDGRGLSRGDRAYYRPDSGRLETPDGALAADAGWPSERLSSAAEALAGRGKADTVEVDGLRVFVDGIAAPDDLVVFGTGHDVGPVTELAARNDLRVTVVGFRGAVDLAERFPDADRTLTTSPARLGESLDLDSDTYAVVMTHNFVDDRLAVESLLDAGVPYVGIMGPHERFERMCEEFAAEDRAPTEAELERVYTPIGLDLGGGSPYQIAHSIVAEVLAVANDRAPRHLRDREGHIHERVSVEPDSTGEGTDPVGDDAAARDADTPTPE